MHVGIHFPGGGGGHYMHALVQLLLGAEPPKRNVDPGTGHSHRVPHSMPNGGYAVDTDANINGPMSRGKISFVEKCLSFESGYEWSTYSTHLTGRDIRANIEIFEGTKNIVIDSTDHLDHMIMLIRQFYKVMSSRTTVPDGDIIWKEKVEQLGHSQQKSHMMKLLGFDINDIPTDPHRVNDIQLLLWSFVFSVNRLDDYVNLPREFDCFIIDWKNITSPTHIRMMASYLGVTNQDHINNALALANQYETLQPTVMEILEDLRECS